MGRVHTTRPSAAPTDRFKAMELTAISRPKWSAARAFATRHDLGTVTNLQLGGERRHLLEQIAHEPDVSHLKDWCVRVFVDGHNGLAVLHARQMLDCARYPCHMAKFTAPCHTQMQPHWPRMLYCIQAAPHRQRRRAGAQQLCPFGRSAGRC